MRDISVSSRKVLDAAATALAKDPRATLSAIAREAGVSRATLHRAFPNRRALLKAEAEDALGMLEGRVMALPLRDGEPLEVLAGAVATLLPLGARFHFLVSETWLDAEPRIASRFEKLCGRVAAVIERARARGELRCDVPVRFQERLFFELIYLGWGSIADQLLVPDDAVRAVTAAFLSGQGAPSKRAKGGRGR